MPKGTLNCLLSQRISHQWCVPRGQENQMKSYDCSFARIVFGSVRRSARPPLECRYRRSIACQGYGVTGLCPHLDDLYFRLHELIWCLRGQVLFIILFVDGQYVPCLPSVFMQSSFAISRTRCTPTVLEGGQCGWMMSMRFIAPTDFLRQRQ